MLIHNIKPEDRDQAEGLQRGDAECRQGWKLISCASGSFMDAWMPVCACLVD